MIENSVIVEEKVDGANLGISLKPDGKLQVQNRGQYLSPPFSGQFSRLKAWLAQHDEKLRTALIPGQIIFGEWCAAKHSLNYTKLPDWLLVFDVFDHEQNKFWSCSKRDKLALALGLQTVPRIFTGKVSIDQLIDLVKNQGSHYRSGQLEGIIIRRDSEEWCESRAKLVRSDFTQSIEDHWRKKNIEWNKVKPNQ
ncbi:RNA ligase family protein [Pseudomonas atagonensis]|uniref:RNA ligase family protein n=1 Tax=Pseudomonas atagonensis TaxID=2609964 RepID=UPI001FEA345D|nr:RNA ligase family protein [Pseudomonas atagonensis]